MVWHDRHQDESHPGYQSARVTVRERHDDGWSERTVPDSVSEETAVALVFNGISHAVMMATPADLADFALGFSLTEGLITGPEDLFAVDVDDYGETGIELQCHIHGACMDALKRQRRSLAGRTGCGLCGRETLEAALPALPVSAPVAVAEAAVVQRALTHLDQHQRLQQMTGTIHAACWCDSQGEVRMLREDVGRHNALDKLIGALAAQDVETSGGFALVSSRGSHEMVAKAAQAHLGTLVTISGVTALAIRQAKQTGLNLIGFARRGRQVVYAGGAS
ncbi:FdhD protein [Tamilnaduibacter salinus]|uniref:Sulfur carrier protein FdhD n=1 Tax=Tamilnaduibacter salinus TaxID=1484056 RepID=A0A2U1D0I6_9GAMM|nr:formate dehydrogenase accessory sulfurtransferase FdhD [Tamilnaduibacter salinus]PVY78897.1 FdhD protein [Tamilnaduibacter salinus]